MNPFEYDQLARFEATYWWHLGRNELIRTLVTRHLTPSGGRSAGEARLLDLGCGTGEVVHILSGFGRVIGVDASPRAVEFCRRRGLSDIRQATVEELDFGDSTFDLVTAFDILEHLEDDVSAMKEARRVLVPGGVFLATVPAHKFLWSEHDEALMHRRRYARRELSGRLREAGFSKVSTTYFVSTLFLPIWGFRTLNTLFGRSEPQASYVPLPDWLNSALASLLKREVAGAVAGLMPPGVTLLAVCRK